MQNKGDNYIDPTFTDQAWTDMLGKLDKELPQERKRRPLLWWWLALGLLIVGSSGVLAWHWLSEPPASSDTPSKPAVVSPPVVLASPLDDCPPAPPKPIAAQHPLKDIRLNAPSDSPRYLAAPSRPVIIALATDPPAEPIGLVAPAWSATAINTSVVETISSASVADPASSIAVSVSTERQVADLAWLPVIPATALDVAPSAGLQMPSPTGKKPHRLALWVESGLIGRASVGGLYAGPGVSYLLAGRWSLSTGLRYQFMRQNLTSSTGGLGLFQSASNLEQEPINNGTEGVLDQAFRFGGVIKSHWLEVPIGVDYRLGNRWRLSAGMYAGYLIKAFTPRGLVIVSNRLTQSDSAVDMLPISGGTTSFSNWYAATDQQQVANVSETRRLQTGFWGTLAFQASPAWQLSLGIRKGSGSWLDSEPYYLSSQYWQAGLRYYLGK